MYQSAAKKNKKVKVPRSVKKQARLNRQQKYNNNVAERVKKYQDYLASEQKKEEARKKAEKNRKKKESRNRLLVRKRDYLLNNGFDGKITIKLLDSIPAKELDNNEYYSSRFGGEQVYHFDQWLYIGYGDPTKEINLSINIKLNSIYSIDSLVERIKWFKDLAPYAPIGRDSGSIGHTGHIIFGVGSEKEVKKRGKNLWHKSKYQPIYANKSTLHGILVLMATIMESVPMSQYDELYDNVLNFLSQNSPSLYNKLKEVL